MNKVLRTILFFFLGLLFLLPLFFLIGKEGWEKIWMANLLYLGLFFLASLIFWGIDSLRWRIILDALAHKKVTGIWNYFVTYAISAALGQFVSQLGGFFIARPSIMKQRYELSYKISVFSSIIEKSADLYFVTLLLIPGLLFFFVLDNINQILLATVLSIGIGFILYGLFAHKYTLIVSKAYFLFKKKQRQMSFKQFFREQNHFKMNYWIIGLWSVLRYIPLFMRVWFLTLAFGITIPLLFLFFGLPVSQLTMVFAITPGAMGFLEGGWFAVLNMANINQNDIALFLLGQRAVLILFSSITLLFLTFGYPRFFKSIFKVNRP